MAYLKKILCVVLSFFLILSIQAVAMDDTTDLDQFERLFPSRIIPEDAEVTRVAPSPTGFPHIGTALQIVLNKAVANRVEGGVFLLRIEDTDRSRTVAGAQESIFDCMEWLGLVADESPTNPGVYGPYIQSERLQIYKIAAEHLRKTGFAYPCFCSAERLEHLRSQMSLEKIPPKYDGFCRSINKLEAEERMYREPYVIRLIMPEDQDIICKDLIRGEVKFNSANLDDMVIFKSDGFPTYHLASVVDDHFMRVTTVIRGEEWLSSTPKHVLLYNYFGWDSPKFVHTPVLRDEQRKKLSKRNGDTSINWFKKQGILPQVFRNFLSRLVWGHPEGLDVYPFADFCRLLRIENLSTSGPVVDYNLLLHISSQYLSNLDPETKVAEIRRYLDFVKSDTLEVSKLPSMDIESSLSPEYLNLFCEEFSHDFDRSINIVRVLADRLKRLTDIFQYDYFFPRFYKQPLIEEMEISLKTQTIRPILLELDSLSVITSRFTHAERESMLRELASRHTVKVGTVFMVLRSILTNKTNTPNIFDILDILGFEESDRRLKLVLS